MLDEIEKREIILVDVKVNSGNSIKITLDSVSGVTIDECVEISRFVESNFDRDAEDFELEVTSYGISQPFILPLHYQKNLLKNVEVHLNNNKIIKGVLQNYEFENENLKNIDILVKKRVQLEGKKRKTEIEEITMLSGHEIRKVLLLLDF